MSTTAPFLRRPILSHETHARQMGLALVRAHEHASRRQIIERTEWFMNSLIAISNLDDDDTRSEAIQIHVMNRCRAAQDLPPLTCEATYSDLVTPADRKGFVSRLVARLADAFDCKGAWD